MDFKDIIAQIKSLLRESFGLEFVFGEPRQIKDTYLVTVAKTSFGFGGGGGSSSSQANKKKAAAGKDEKPEETDSPEPGIDEIKEDKQPGTSPKKQEANFGGGGGGSFKIEPIGIYLIKNDRARFYPVISFKHIVGIFSVLSILIWRLARKK